jgi:hypothetical protein
MLSPEFKSGKDKDIYREKGLKILKIYQTIELFFY